ncbi:MAG: T9SS type A sorting domain-containing protein [Flavobacteriales bacterium]|nr:T9SS type A sorting domain-containing protein [Flavobacteriales bacterium]
MKKILPTLIFLILQIIATSQNNKPIAIDDNYTIGGFAPLNVLINDYDPDGNDISIIGIIYNQNNNRMDSVKFSTIPNIGKIFCYLNSCKYFGMDTLKYIICDNGSPSLCDTATIYITIPYTFCLKNEWLEGANIRCVANADGSLFYNKNKGMSGFEAPKDSGMYSIFSSALWVGGKDNSGNFCTTVLTYFGDNNRVGPYTDTSYYTWQEEHKWNRLWKIEAYDIAQHKLKWNQIGYQLNMPEVIVHWPAHGDTTKGQAYYLAPFYDYNNDGKYTPQLGDYPLIKGHKALYFIYHDNIADYPQGMNIEIHGMLYAIECNEALNNTIFLKYKIYNRSNKQYDSTYVAQWTDLDLGFSEDDFMASDVNRSLYYAYNGDAIDESGSGNGGYGNHPAAQSVVFLKGAKLDNDGNDNNFGIGINESPNGIGFGDGIPNNEYWGMNYFIVNNSGGGPQGDPITPKDYYNYMSGKRKDDTCFKYFNTSICSRFMYPGNSDTYWYGTSGLPQIPWHEALSGNAPGDRRGVASSGPFTFKVSDVQEIDLAYVFGRNTNIIGAQAGVNKMLQNVDSIRFYFNKNKLPCGGNFMFIEKQNIQKQIYVCYPNPFSTKIIIENRSDNTTTAYFQLFDVLGTLVYSTVLNNQQNEIKLPNLNKSIYIGIITDNKGKQSFKLVKE